VERWVALDDRLELRARFGVLAAALIGEAGVVLSLRKGTPGVRLLRIRRRREGLGDRRAAGIVPVLLLVVRRELLQRRVEVCRGFLADGVALGVRFATRLFGSERMTGTGPAATRGEDGDAHEQERLEM